MTINLCNSCDSSVICSVKDKNDSLKAQGISSVVTNCRFFLSNNKNTAITQAPERDFSASGISDLSDRIHQILGDKDEEAEIKKASPDEACAICGATNVDLLKCHKCDEWVCQDCSVEDIHGCVTCDNCSVSISMFDL